MAAGKARRKKCLGAACLVILGGEFLVQNTRAGETWTGGTAANDNKWSTPDNWTPFGAPANDGTAHIVMLGPMHPDVWVDVPWNINSLTFPAGALGFSITGSTLTIGSGGISNSSDMPQAILTDKISFGGSIRNIDVADGLAETDLLISSIIMSGGLSKSGLGTLVMSGIANTYTGTTTVLEGTLVAGKSGVDASIRGDLRIGGGPAVATLKLSAAEQIAAIGNTVEIAPGGTLALNGFSETIGDLVMTSGQITDGMLTVLGEVNGLVSPVPAMIA